MSKYIDPYGFSKGGKSSGGSGSSGGYVDPYGFAKSAKAAKPAGGHHGGSGGVGGFFGHLVSDAGNAITGLPKGVERIGKAVGEDVAHPKDLAKLLLAPTDPLLIQHTHVGHDVVVPIAHQYAHEYGPLLHGHFRQFGHQVYEHPLGPILDALTVATLGAGGVGKAGELASEAGMISKASRLAHLRDPVDLTVPDFGTEGRVVIKQSARNPLVRWRQELTNKALNKLPSETPIVGSTARAVRAISRVSGREAARIDVQARDFSQAWTKLSKPEQAAWHLKARGLTPESYRTFLAGQADASPAMLKLLQDPKISALVGKPTAALQRALEEGRALSDRLTASRVAAGHLDERTALEAPYRHLKLLSGAKVEPVSVESATLKAARAERDSLAALHEKALQAEEHWLKEAHNRDLGSLSPADAHARLAYLDSQYEQLIQKTVPHVSPYGGKLSRQAQLERNFVAGKTGRAPLSVSDEERQLADNAIRGVVAHPNHAHLPAAQDVARLIHERDQLHAALQAHAEAPIMGHEPPEFPSAPAHAHASVPPPSNPFRDAIVTVGHRLEAAQSKVDGLGDATTQSGDVRLGGGKSVEQLIQEIEAAGGEHPFYVPDSAHVPGAHGRFSSKPSGFSAPAQGVKQSRLVLASHGRINPFENALGKDFVRYRDRAAAQLLHDELVKHAAIVPHGGEIPRGWAELKLNRGEASAPYTARVAARLEHEVGDQGIVQSIREAGRPAPLTQPRALGGHFEEAHRLVVPEQVQKLLEDESQSYASRLAAIRRVPLNAWKAAVLGLRPAFFANITIGNSILGTLQMAPGRWGMVGWLNQVLPGFERVAGARLSEATMKDVFPEQVTGTFGESVSPRFGASKAGRIAHRVSAGVMPATIGYENVLRRAMAEGWARSLPEVQKALDQSGGDINTALRSLDKTNPRAVDNISRRIDNALGNYRTYSKFERAIKSVVPFYGWNRHITSSLFRLASERPQVLDALLNTGDTGKAKADRILGALPDYLSQVLPVHLPAALGGQHGHGVQTILDPHAWNPFSTITDEARLAGSPFGHAGAASDAFPLAPDLQALIEQMTGKSLLTGAPIKGNAFRDELLNLVPQEGLFTSKHPRSPHSINQNHLYAQLLRILGLPVENINLGSAHYAARPKREITIPAK